MKTGRALIRTLVKHYRTQVRACVRVYMHASMGVHAKLLKPSFNIDYIYFWLIYNIIFLSC